MVQALTNRQKCAAALVSVTHLHLRTTRVISSRSNNEQWSTYGPSNARCKHIRKLISILQSNYPYKVILDSSNGLMTYPHTHPRLTLTEGAKNKQTVSLGKKQLT